MDYSDRKWLNPEGSPSTGSVTAYHGAPPWKQGRKKEMLTLLEIADCHGKVRLHRTDYDTAEDFISKMEKLRSVIDGFIAHLRKEK